MEEKELMPTVWWLSVIAAVVLTGGAIFYQAYSFYAEENDRLRHKLNACELREVVHD